MKKILHIVYGFETIGGLENGLINIINGSDCKKFIHVICSLTKNGTIANRVKNKNVFYYSLHKKDGNDPLLPFRLYNIIRKERPDAVHLRNWPSMVEGFVAAKMGRVNNIIYSEHGRHFDSVWNGQRVKTAIIRHILNSVDHCLCVSADVAKEMKELYQLSRPVEVILNGVDSDKFSPKSEEDFGRTENKFVIGSVGRLDKGKRYDHLIDDFDRIHEGVELRIVGDGQEFDNLKKLAKSKSHHKEIKLLGSLDNVEENLQQFSVFVLPSESEGLSNAIMEAMSCGLPIVAYDVGGNRELVKQELGGFLVKDSNRHDFMEKIKYLYERPLLREQMGRFNRQYIVDNYSLKNMVQKYEQIYAGK